MASAMPEVATRRSVTSTINYVPRDDVRPLVYINAQSSMNFDPRRIEITDVRGASEQPSLDREGFALFRHSSAVRRFHVFAEVMTVQRGPHALHEPNG